mmetsp:Transcript_7355/g.17419  ORF Transcript_7355/g.17419 Transcript_7355/m.17419 type:complete len:101 (-) Transcript_7355:1373-1675(-)
MCGTCRQQCTVRVEFPVSFHNPTLPLLWQTCTASLANTRQHLLQEVSQLWEQWVRNVFKHRASTDTSRRNLLVDGRTTSATKLGLDLAAVASEALVAPCH